MQGRLEVTDDKGCFRIDRLPAGQFSLTATKPAYLQGAYGGQMPGRAGIPIVLAAGQHLAEITLTMARGAAVAGTVRLPNGEPAADSDVTVYRVPPGGGEQTLVETVRVLTDDRGAYRAYGLMPGEYQASSAPPCNRPVISQSSHCDWNMWAESAASQAPRASGTSRSIRPPSAPTAGSNSQASFLAATG